jgi:hypothetical protein
MPDPKKKLTKEVKLDNYEWVVPLNSRNRIHLNPLVYGEFKKTAPNDCNQLAAYFLDDEDTELGLFWTTDDPDASKVLPSTSEGTASASLGLLVTKYPRLKVEKGRERPFPAKLIPYEGSYTLVLTVKNIDSVPVETKRKSRTTSKPAADPPAATGS